MRVSANVNERVRFELYYPPFQAAVDVGVLSVMCAYNRINDVYACQNNETFSHLREDLGFKGFIFSDWTATKSTVTSVKAGLDQELPFGTFYSALALERAIKAGDLTLGDVDKSVLRILTTMYSIGLFDNPTGGDPLANVTSDAHNELARKIAATSTVLLKNTDSLLPLSIERIQASASKCIAVIGDQDTVSGGGSGHVTPAYVITPAQGVQNAVHGEFCQTLSFVSSLNVLLLSVLIA
jgi:beta-glucosidase